MKKLLAFFVLLANVALARDLTLDHPDDTALSLQSIFKQILNNNRRKSTHMLFSVK